MMIKFLSVILLVSGLGLNPKEKEYEYVDRIQYLERKHVEKDHFGGMKITIRRYIYVYKRNVFNRLQLINSISLGGRYEKAQEFPIPTKVGPYETVIIKSLSKIYTYKSNVSVPRFITKEYRYKTRDITLHYRIKDDFKNMVVQ